MGRRRADLASAGFAGSMERELRDAGQRQQLPGMKWKEHRVEAIASASGFRSRTPDDDACRAIQVNPLMADTEPFVSSVRMPEVNAEHTTLPIIGDELRL